MKKNLDSLGNWLIPELRRYEVGLEDAAVSERAGLSGAKGDMSEGAGGGLKGPPLATQTTWASKRECQSSVIWHPLFFTVSGDTPESWEGAAFLYREYQIINRGGTRCLAPKSVIIDSAPAPTLGERASRTRRFFISRYQPPGHSLATKWRKFWTEDRSGGWCFFHVLRPSGGTTPKSVPPDLM